MRLPRYDHQNVVVDWSLLAIGEFGLFAFICNERGVLRQIQENLSLIIFKEGSFVCDYDGLWMPKEFLVQPGYKNNAYLWTSDDVSFAVDGSSFNSSPGRFANEGLQYNNCIIDYRHGRLGLWALRDISNCEELLVGYGLAFWLHHYHPVMTPKAIMYYA